MRGHRCRELGAGAPESASIVTEKRSPAAGNRLDSARRVARVGAGVKWGELLDVTSPHGLTGLAGSSTDPTVVGYTLGGGVSWFGRSFGLAAHSVLSIDIVDATGERHPTTDPELFWALRGGGGDFGIVLSIQIALYPEPQLYGGRLLWPVEMAFPELHAFRTVTSGAPDELTLWAQFLQFPPITEVPEPLRGGSFIAVDVAYLGSADDVAPLLALFREIPAIVLDTLGTMPISLLGTIAAEPVDPTPTAEISWLMGDLDDKAIEALTALVGHGWGSPPAVVQLRHLATGTGRRGRCESGREPRVGHQRIMTSGALSASVRPLKPAKPNEAGVPTLCGSRSGNRRCVTAWAQASGLAVPVKRVAAVIISEMRAPSLAGSSAEWPAGSRA